MDIGPPQMIGIRALERIKSDQSDVLVIMITGFEDVDIVLKSIPYMI